MLFLSTYRISIDGKISPELREAVLRQVLSGDMTATEASCHFDIEIYGKTKDGCGSERATGKWR